MNPDDRSGEPGGHRIAIVGGGQIGVGWAITFARAGSGVAIYEPAADRRRAIPSEMVSRLAELDAHGLLPEDPEDVVTRVGVGADLAAAVEGATHVQECIPESLDLKVDLFRRLDALADAGTTLASSSSSMTISDIASELEGRARCLLVHPGNPPYLVKVVEVAPAPFTDPDAVEAVRHLLTLAGMVPVTIRREIECLVFNRLQGALLREALCLVRDGVIAPADLDRVVTEGLGRRWSIIGPLTTAELNTRGGIRAHARTVGAAYARMAVDRGSDNPWTEEVIERVAEDLEARFPSARREEHLQWRDRQLMRLESDRRQQT
ncbi:MAG: 3-hydroxyacyl-CoA dehydrogenase [bacterium]|nr:3-hydroxyacyl-CoA dehydrogenase [bacterium]MDE0290329.1 3-hydroxyacyl-CoA dehydrogenase [bacterium]MDE0440258.1 3-hydroxyacyl-CoA dehydrogenase [bacterium]